MLKRFSTFSIYLLLLTLTSTGLAQDSRISQDIRQYESAFRTIPVTSPFSVASFRSPIAMQAAQQVEDALFFEADFRASQSIIETADEFLRMEIPFEKNQTLTLRLKRADIFTPTFKVTTATGGDTPFDYQRGAYYWGVVEGHDHSLVSISFSQQEISGFIQLDDEHYSIGKLENDDSFTHILYKTNKLPNSEGFSCHTSDDELIEADPHMVNNSRDASNCVKMYIQVDYDLYLAKGGVQQAADYVNNAFTQVAIMYANEQINFTVNEIFVWNTTDPFTGPTTSNYLTQFRSYLNGSYNGDLAHLVGTNGGGGIAYLNVLCNSYSGVGYSAINLSFNPVPAYSWTVMVLTHEIGHNLGSPHTHACAWNGNNTAIDGCGPAAGYSEGCSGPIPSEGGTVMSYCHLVNGINMSLGFGPQPGDLIRSRVYNASCLTSCGPPVQNDAGITAIAKPVAFPCESSTTPEVTLKNFGAAQLTSVTIQYKIDNGPVSNYNWSGNLSPNQAVQVILPSISYGTNSHTFYVNTTNPNGQPDEKTSNDAMNKGFTYHQDWCTCLAATANLSPNPLTHTGNGSSQATVSLGAGSKRPQFTISNLNFKNNGQQNGRFNEQVVVWYYDAYGNYKVYGTFQGSQQSSVNVNIQDVVNQLGVTLSNNLNNGYTGQLSVSFSTVSYCGPEGPCLDSDGDGVCNDDDICPGFDDNLIGTSCDDGDPCTLNDMYTENCTCEGNPDPGCGCVEETDNFSPNPLNHINAGSSQSIATLDPGNSDPSFTISGLNARTSGNPNQRFIEEVTVRYTNAANQDLLYGVFRGDQVSSVNVSISGVVQNIRLTLRDAYDGNSSTQLSVNMTSVTSCVPAGLINSGEQESLFVYPNPAKNEINIQLPKMYEQAEVMIYNMLGKLVGQRNFENTQLARISISELGIGGQQMLILNINGDGENVGTQKVLILH